jgi:hypothetical protein
MYLLSSQALLDLVTGHPKMTGWVQGIPSLDVGISVLSFGRVKQVSETLPNEDPRKGNLDNAITAAAGIMRNTGRIESFDYPACLIWIKLLNIELNKYSNGNTVISLDDEDRMIIATAIDRALVYVEHAQPYHSILSDLFPFRTLDPY